MSKKSTVRRNLPDEVREDLDRLIVAGKLTLDQMLAFLESKGQGGKVSRSALGRYSQSLDDVAKELRLVREMSIAMRAELEEVADGDGGRMIIESLQALLLRARMQIASEDALDVEEVSLLARAMKDLQAALKSNVETEMKIRDRVAREAAEAAAKVATAKGISAETVEEIKAKILGIARTA